MIKTLSRICAFIIATAIIFIGCKKNEITVPPEQVHFLNMTGGTYNVVNDTVTFKVRVGVTTVSNTDRTFTLGVVSNTGAVQNTQYRLSKTTITFPAGRVIDSFTVKGVYSLYQTSGRKDSLKFFITGPAKEALMSYNDTFKLFMRGPCFEGDVDLNAFRGTYANTNELLGTSPYGPYTTTISAVNQLTATTGTVTVTNIWDNGWGPITFLLDWTNPNSRTATVVSQAAIPGSNAGDLNTTYSGQTIAVRPFSGQPGTFSACNGTLSLKMQLGVTNLGFFNVLYTVNMAR